MKKILCILSLLIIAQFSLAEKKSEYWFEKEGWCRDIERCIAGDILYVRGTGSRTFAARFCEIDTIERVGEAHFVCVYRGSEREER